MASEEEKAALRPARAGLVPPDRGQQREIAERLHKLMEARIDDEFEFKGKKIDRVRTHEHDGVPTP
eukprot:6189938-Prymnesium_polylepis.1